MPIVGRRKIYLITMLMIFLSSCGGGGGGSSNPTVASGASSSSVTLINQTFTFKDVGPITVSLNDALTNKALGQGSGAITYSSTNTSVATVDSEGVVTPRALGNTEIIASIVADARYSAASTSYQLVVSNNTNVTAWIGSNDALLELPSAMSGSELYSSNDKNCNWNDYLNCINGILNIITPSGFADKNATLNNPAYYLLKNNNKKANFVLSKSVAPSVRYESRVVTFRNQMWLIGGDSYSNSKNDIWSSSNGVVWTQQTSAAAFSPRAPQAVLTFNDKLWLFGSKDQSAKDIWSSVDGVNWTKVSAVMPFTFYAKTYFHVVVFNNQLWIIASSFSDANGVPSVELFSSTDGISWKKHAIASEFFNAQPIVKGNKLLLLGAGGADRYYSLDTTVWSSTDGDNWIKETSNAKLTYGEYRTIVSHGNKFFAIAGAIILPHEFSNPWINDDNDVWSSDDGVYWTKLVDHATFPTHVNPEVVEFDNQLWLVGSGAGDIWASTDGIDWSLKTTDIDIPETSNNYLLSDGNRLLLGIGSHAIDGITGGVWSSQNGINWSKQKTTTPVELTSFRPPSTGNVVYFKDKFWTTIGLELYGFYPARHISSSVNGVDWVKEKINGLPISDLPMNKITVPQIVKFKNKLWMYGFDYIWTSSDGVNWDVMLEKMPLTPDNPGLGQRLRLEILDDNTLLLIRTNGAERQFDSPVNAWISHDGVTWVNHPLPLIGLVESTVSFNHKFWLFVRGGKYIPENGRDFEGVLSSADGINWELATENLPFPMPSDFQVIAHKDKLLLFGGGFFPNEPNRKAVWSSTDGISWRLGFSHPLDFTQ